LRDLDSFCTVSVLLGQSLNLSAEADASHSGIDDRSLANNMRTSSSVLFGESLAGNLRTTSSAIANRGRISRVNSGGIADNNSARNSSSVSRSRVDSAGGIAESEGLGLDVGGCHGLSSHDSLVGMPGVRPGRNRRRVRASGRRNTSGALNYARSRRVDEGAVLERCAGGCRQGSSSRGVEEGAVLERCAGGRRQGSRGIDKGAVLERCTRGCRQGSSSRGVEEGAVLKRCAGGRRRANG
jgi:hypothetical protein